MVRQKIIRHVFGHGGRLFFAAFSAAALFELNALFASLLRSERKRAVSPSQAQKMLQKITSPTCLIVCRNIPFIYLLYQHCFCTWCYINFVPARFSLSNSCYTILRGYYPPVFTQLSRAIIQRATTIHITC